MTFKPGGRVDKSDAHIWMTGTLDHEAMCIKCMDESWSHKELWITSIYIIGGSLWQWYKLKYVNIEKGFSFQFICGNLKVLFFMSKIIFQLRNGIPIFCARQNMYGFK